jgi:hypothetical protein
MRLARRPIDIAQNVAQRRKGLLVSCFYPPRFSLLPNLDSAHPPRSLLKTPGRNSRALLHHPCSGQWLDNRRNVTMVASGKSRQKSQDSRQPKGEFHGEGAAR